MIKKYLLRIKKLRSRKNFTISIAESCTGGMISSQLTSMSGSSDYFNGSIISYSNEFKNELLDVPLNTISNHGAVSHQTALRMVKGLSNKCDSNILISVTGVAGPNGGSKNTPIGCIYFGIGIKIKSKYHFKTVRKIFKKNTRRNIQLKGTEYALFLILKSIREI